MQQATWWIDALSNITTDRDYFHQMAGFHSSSSSSKVCFN